LSVTVPTLLRAAVGPAEIVCSGRHGGVSPAPYDSLNVGDHVGDALDAVGENRRRIATAAAFPDPVDWTWLDQRHGIDVYVVDHENAAARARVPIADAAVTAVLGHAVAVVTADCAPLVIASDDAVGVVHAGHRGLFDGVIERAVEQLRAIGGPRVRAFLGPCIRPARYEFGARDLVAFVDRFGAQVAARTDDDAPALDLPAAVRTALERAGVDDRDVADCGICTSASPDHFSYRRDGTTGRQVTVARLP
jgi:YfiH family protein